MLDSIRVLRAMAASSVMLFHFKEALSSGGLVSNWLISISSVGGRFGVSLFFLISGFVIALATEGKVVKTGAFLKRRLVRIFPLAAVTTLICFALKILLVRGESPSLVDLVGSLLFLPLRNESPPFYGYRLLSVQWTLTFELVFYTVFAISLGLSQSHRVMVATVLLMLMVFGSQGLYDCCTLDVYSSPLAVGQGPLAGLMSLLANPIFMLFVVGMWLYRGYAATKRYPGVSLEFGYLFFLVLWLLEGSVYLPPEFWASLFVFLVVLYFENRIRSSRCAKMAARLGDISYSLYLVHPVVLVLFRWLSGSLEILRLIPGLLVFGILILASVILSDFSYRWIEQPGVKLGKRLSRSGIPG